MKKRRMRARFAMLFAAVFLLMPFSVGLAKADAEPVVIVDDGTIAQGVKIESLDVSGLTPAQALQKLQSEEGRAMTDAAVLVLTLPYSYITVDLEDLKAEPKLEPAVGNAMKVGRSGGISTRQSQIETAKTAGTSVNVPYGYDEAALAATLTTVANGIPRDNLAGVLAFDKTKFDNPFTVTDGHIGFTPDTEGLIKNVKQAMASGAINGVTVPGTSLAANGTQTLKAGTAANTVLLSKFNLSPISNSGGRFHNIASGCNLINGTVLQPGAVFSFNDTLGPRDGPHDGLWAPAPVNEDGRHEMDYGGGLCRVSTTLLNAVSRADLEIVEWVYHSIPSDYIQIGCDATISTGGPDFKFKNNTDWPLYVLMKFDTQTRIVSAQIWGSPRNVVRDAQSKGVADAVNWGLGTKQNPATQAASGTWVSIELMGKITGYKGMPETQYTNDPAKVRDGRGGIYTQTFRLWYKWTIGADGKGKWVEFKRDLYSTNLYPAFAPIVFGTPTPVPTATSVPLP